MSGLVVGRDWQCPRRRRGGRRRRGLGWRLSNDEHRCAIRWRVISRARSSAPVSFQGYSIYVCDRQGWGSGEKFRIYPLI